jgi:hypothetical protein
MRSNFIKSILKFFLHFTMGVIGYVIAGGGFFLLLIGFNNDWRFAVLGLFCVLLGVYLFFNIDVSLSKLLRIGKKPE